MTKSMNKQLQENIGSLKTEVLLVQHEIECIGELVFENYSY